MTFSLEREALQKGDVAITATPIVQEFATN